MVEQMSRRVLLFHSQAEGYGSDRSLLLLATGLRRQGWMVEVAVPEDGPLVGDLRRSGVPVHLVDPGVLRRVYRPRDWAAFVSWRLARSVVSTWRLSRRFDVVHVNTSVVIGAVLGAALARRPAVLHVRESYAGRERALRWYARVVSPLVGATVAISEAIGEELRATAFGRRTRVIPNGLEFGDPPSREGARPSTVVCVGRINEWKGQEVAVGAMALLRDAAVDAELLIAGDVYPGGEQFRLRLERRIEELGLADRVRLLGFVDDITSLFARAGVFVLPATRPEPFGLALVEAMGAGLACVATDHGGPREIISDGKTGLLVAPGDERQLADALRGLVTSPTRQARLGDAARADVRHRFGIERTVAGVTRLYEDLLRPRPAEVAL